MKNNERYINQAGVTIVTNLKPSADKQKLDALLKRIENNMRDRENAPVYLPDVSTLHYIRWVIVDNAWDADGNKMPDALIMSSNFDGPLDEHLQELLNNGRSAMHQIYDFCEGFDASRQLSDQEVISYLKRHKQGNPLFWPAFRGGTAEQIKEEYKLVEEIQQYLDQEQAKGTFSDMDAGQIREKVKAFAGAKDDLKWALQQRTKPSLGWYVKYYGKLVLRLLLVLVLLPIILVFILPVWWGILSRVFEKRDDRRRKPIKRDEAIMEAIREENRIYQNQLTIYGTIKKPYWYRLNTLRMGLFIFSTNGIYRANKGKLSGIETIHFARWSLFNNNKNVMFLSNYDGPWQIYLSEFIDNSASAMNLTFSNMKGYPKTRYLLWEGAFDEQKFKTVVRNNQYPAQVWYSAYPYYSIKNILNNNKIRKGLDGSSKESAEEWIKRL